MVRQEYATTHKVSQKRQPDGKGHDKVTKQPTGCKTDQNLVTMKQLADNSLSVTKKYPSVLSEEPDIKSKLFRKSEK